MNMNIYFVCICCQKLYTFYSVRKLIFLKRTLILYSRPYPNIRNLKRPGISVHASRHASVEIHVNAFAFLLHEPSDGLIVTVTICSYK